jgi:hypothetical protein
VRSLETSQVAPDFFDFLEVSSNAAHSAFLNWNVLIKI